jgi:TRAP-type C4-dicarboxylate transport system permease small subunit
MLYDKMPPRSAASFRLLGNILITAAFSTLIVASYRYAIFTGFQKTPVFRISLTVIFLPFTYFLCSIIGYTLKEIVEDIRVLSGLLKDSEDHKARRKL